MASSQSVTQTVTNGFKKILNPTKIVTWSIVRRPPVEKESVIQGKPRKPNSNAFKTHQWKEGVRLRKALNAITHGKNIYVYNNIRTNQVVYSLTRYLEERNVLKQLVFHGKKTVPATLRKDMWVPYYSVHFTDPKLGLRAYHLLREFAMQRQLSPPRELISITEQWLERKRPRDPNKVEEFEEKYKDKLGWLLEKKERARALMDQKATSVADIAAVLAIQEEEVKNGFADGKRGYLTRTARRRRRAAREKEAQKAAEQAERVANFTNTLAKTHGISCVIEDAPDKGEYELKGEEVKILWSDLQDARYAQSWPERVRHGELDLSRDHVMPGQKPIEMPDLSIIADGQFNEKNPEKNLQKEL